MAKLNIPPTKSNLLKVKESHKTASEGYELLEQKREILVIELMSYIERVKRIEKDMDNIINDAYSSLKKSFKTIGHEEVKRKSRFITYKYSMKKKSIRLIGMHIPSIEVEPPELEMQYSFMNTNSMIDETQMKFIKMIKLMSELTEIKAIVWRLSREVKKTQRRVNALEKMIIPQTKETIKFIEDTLEEKEREEMFISKMVKEKLKKQF